MKVKSSDLGRQIALCDEVTGTIAEKEDRRYVIWHDADKQDRISPHNLTRCRPKGGRESGFRSP